MNRGSRCRGSRCPTLFPKLDVSTPVATVLYTVRYRGRGPDVGGPDVGGTDVGGTDVGGPDVGGPDVGGQDVGGPDVGGPDVRFPIQPRASNLSIKLLV